MPTNCFSTKITIRKKKINFCKRFCQHLLESNKFTKKCANCILGGFDGLLHHHVATYGQKKMSNFSTFKTTPLWITTKQLLIVNSACQKPRIVAEEPQVPRCLPSQLRSALTKKIKGLSKNAEGTQEKR